MAVENSILEMEVQVNNIIKDLRQRVSKIFDKYTEENGKIPKLPDYDELRKSSKMQYEISRRLTDCIDELMDVKIRVNLVRRSLEDIQSIQSTSRSDYTFLNNFKNNLRKYDEELSGYRFEIADLIKNANNKLRVLEAIPFHDE